MIDRNEILEQHFVEEIGLLYQEMGAPPIWGRILGRLLICDPERQNLTQLADYLNASKSALSTATRQLLAARLVERVPVPGERGTYYRIRSEAWSDLMRARMQHLELLRETAEKGLGLLKDAPPERRRRLERFHAFYDFMHKHVPALIDDWDEEQP